MERRVMTRYAGWVGLNSCVPLRMVFRVFRSLHFRTPIGTSPNPTNPIRTHRPARDYKYPRHRRRLGCGLLKKETEEMLFFSSLKLISSDVIFVSWCTFVFLVFFFTLLDRARPTARPSDVLFAFHCNPFGGWRVGVPRDVAAYTLDAAEPRRDFRR